MRQAAHTGRPVKQPLTPASPTHRIALTSREQEILLLIWSGFTSREIGDELRISMKTVEAHRANMMMKMRVSNTARLLRTAIQEGLLTVG